MSLWQKNNTNKRFWGKNPSVPPPFPAMFLSCSLHAGLHGTGEPHVQRSLFRGVFQSLIDLSFSGLWKTWGKLRHEETQLKLIKATRQGSKTQYKIKPLSNKADPAFTDYWLDIHYIANSIHPPIQITKFRCFNHCQCIGLVVARKLWARSSYPTSVSHTNKNTSKPYAKLSLKSWRCADNILILWIKNVILLMYMWTSECFWQCSVGGGTRAHRKQTGIKIQNRMGTNTRQ